MTTTLVVDPPKPHLRGRSHEYAFVVAATLAPLMIAAAPGIVPRFVVAPTWSRSRGCSVSARSTTGSTGRRRPEPG
ncbi:MAG: hypothetical protein R2695_11470 [Acidimicrobiales bacterium]